MLIRPPPSSTLRLRGSDGSGGLGFTGWHLLDLPSTKFWVDWRDVGSGQACTSKYGEQVRVEVAWPSSWGLHLAFYPHLVPWAPTMAKSKFTLDKLADRSVVWCSIITSDVWQMDTCVIVSKPTIRVYVTTPMSLSSFALCSHLQIVYILHRETDHDTRTNRGQVKTKIIFCERSIVVFLWFLFACVWSCVMFGLPILCVHHLEWLVKIW